MSDGVLLRQLSRMSSVIGRLGPVSGLSALWSFYHHRLLPGRRPGPRSFPVPDCPMRVWMRPGTTDWHVYEQIFIRRDYELDGLAQSSRLMADYANLLADGKRPVIIDCGANIGLGTIWFKLAFPEAVIYAVEPDRDNFSILERNLAPLSGVFAIRSGVWDHKAVLTITDSTAESWAFELQEHDREEAVDGVTAITIPEILGLVPDGACFIVKIDIEGGERQLFRSNTAWLDHAPLVIIELHDWMMPWEATAASFLSAVSRRKRDYVFRSENLFCFLHSGDDVPGLTSLTARGS
jgi:FkbM family methyltransferase